MLLDDAEIDEWFQQEKEKLAQRLFDDLRRGVPEEKARARFDEDFTKLFRTYEEKYDAASAAKARQEKLQRPFKRFRAWREAKRARLKRWWKVRKERYKKWRFELEYKRLFRKMR